MNPNVHNKTIQKKPRNGSNLSVHQEMNEKKKRKRKKKR